jgi:Uri superfamily endonuclease
VRINRHFSKKKKLRWHIDYLLNSPGVRITDSWTSSLPECRLNQSTRGEIIVNGFGSSDCRNGCGSHLKFVVDCKGTEMDSVLL